MGLTSIVVILFILSPQFECVQNDYKHYKLYDITGNTARLQIDHILQEHSESIINLNSNVDGLQVLVEPRTVPFFKDLVAERRLNVTLLSDDVSEIIRLEKGRKKRQFSWTAYYDVNEIYQFVTNISKAHPTWSEVIVAGKSYEGRKILGIRINTPVEGRQSPKPVFFIESGIHAREWIAPATTTYFINQLLTSSDPNVTRLRDQFDWRIFPTVNPDGYQYSYRFDRYWRKTRSISKNGCIGADPNRNWDYNWGQHSSSSNPCDYQLYAGSKPFSEVETRSLSEYISKIDNLLFYVAFHSYASILLVPYSDSTEHVSNYDDLVEVGKTSIEYGRRVADSEYGGPAPAAEVLYKASGGSMDWVRHALNTPLVYTYELRGRSFHWPASRISEQGDEVTQMMLGLAAGASNLGYF